MATGSESLQTALRFHQAGQFQQAEQLYCQILASNPREAAALRQEVQARAKSGQGTVKGG